MTKEGNADENCDSLKALIIKTMTLSFARKKINVNVRFGIETPGLTKNFTLGHVFVTESNMKLSPGRYVEELAKGIADVFNVPSSKLRLYLIAPEDTFQLYRSVFRYSEVFDGFVMEGSDRLVEYINPFDLSPLKIICVYAGEYARFRANLREIFVPVHNTTVSEIKGHLSMLSDLKKGEFELKYGSRILGDDEVCNSMESNPIQIMYRLSPN